MPLTGGQWESAPTFLLGCSPLLPPPLKSTFSSVQPSSELGSCLGFNSASRGKRIQPPLALPSRRHHGRWGLPPPFKPVTLQPGSSCTPLLVADGSPLTAWGQEEGRPRVNTGAFRWRTPASGGIPTRCSPVSFKPHSALAVCPDHSSQGHVYVLLPLVPRQAGGVRGSSQHVEGGRGRDLTH